jgi:NADH-quinone oxidoreductase subunit N
VATFGANNANLEVVTYSPFASILVEIYRDFTTFFLTTDFLGELIIGGSLLIAILILLFHPRLAVDPKNVVNLTITFLLSTMFFCLLLMVAQYCSPAAVGSNLLTYYLVETTFTLGLKILVIAFSGAILYFSKATFLRSKKIFFEYPIIVTLALIFMLALISATHIITSFIALVGLSLNLYILILSNAPAPTAQEAGVKYFYLSAFSSGLLLYGVFILFSLVGTGHYHTIAASLIESRNVVTTYGSPLVIVAIAFVLIGIFFKLSAFPGHL